MNNYLIPLAEYENRVEKCIELLSDYLNKGTLGLVLGSGVSIDLNLPNWQKLVTDCFIKAFPTEPIKTNYTNEELKGLSNRIKDKLGNKPYIELVKECLYYGVAFDFEYAKKDLLISLMSLMVGKTRGTVTNIITFNFDSVLEWYLKTNGLSVNVTTLDRLLHKNSDVDIIHIHGYLPHDEEYGLITDSIVLAKEEFEDRQIGDSYYKDLMFAFFRRQIFLAIGLSADSLISDICPYLRLLTKWYETEKVSRNAPYGIAFLTSCSSDNREKLKQHGIIPCVLTIPDIYSSIFKIAQSAMNT